MNEHYIAEQKTIADLIITGGANGRSAVMNLMNGYSELAELAKDYGEWDDAQAFEIAENRVNNLHHGKMTEVWLPELASSLERQIVTNEDYSELNAGLQVARDVASAYYAHLFTPHA